MIMIINIDKHKHIENTDVYLTDWSVFVTQLIQKVDSSS